MYDPVRTDGLKELMERQALGKVRNDPAPYKTVKKFFSQKKNIEVTEHVDIGVMYGVVTAFLGYGALECGKTMGLSSYGEEDDSLPPMFINEDSILCNKNLFSQSRILNEDCYPVLKTVNDSIQKKANLSFSIQKALEKVFIERVKFIDENYKCKNIVLSGGCALNVVGNSVLAEKFPHMKFFVDPIPYDAGQSLGLAIDWYQQRMTLPDNSGQSCYLGKQYSEDELRTTIENYVKRDGVQMFRSPWGQEEYIAEGDQL
jgi:carbamoyltransferase